jgi:hypothetical protein
MTTRRQSHGFRGSGRIGEFLTQQNSRLAETKWPGGFCRRFGGGAGEDAVRRRGEGGVARAGGKANKDERSRRGKKRKKKKEKKESVERIPKRRSGGTLAPRRGATRRRDTEGRGEEGRRGRRPAAPPVGRARRWVRHGAIWRPERNASDRGGGTANIQTGAVGWPTDGAAGAAADTARGRAAQRAEGRELLPAELRALRAPEAACSAREEQTQKQRRQQKQ